MRWMRKPRRTLPLVFACLVASTAVSEGDDLSPSEIQWSSLALRARRLGQTLRIEASIERSQAGQAISELLSRPADGVALQRTQLDSGRRNRFRGHRFESDGVFSIRRAPGSGEAELPHEEWSEVSDTFRAFPEWAGEGMEVSDPTALFYFLGAAKLENVGDAIQFPVFSRDQLLLVDLKVTGRERTRVEFEKRTRAGSETVRGHLEAIQLLIDGSHLGPDSEEADFEFLGLRGDVEVLLHPELRAPVEVSGRVPRIGRVRIRLTEITVR